MKTDYSAFFTKIAILILILVTVPWPYSLIACLFATWVYQYFIAFFYGVHVMPTMDTICFRGDDNIRVNFISFTIIDKYEFEKVR